MPLVFAWLSPARPAGAGAADLDQRGIQVDRVRNAAAQVEGPAPYAVDTAEHRAVGAHRIGDVKAALGDLAGALAARQACERLR